MTPTSQRIAIAKACGWLDIYRCGRSLNRTTNGLSNGATYAGTKDPPSFNYGREYSELPRYLNDLNAMHEAEKLLHLRDVTYDGITYDALLWYKDTLSDLFGSDYPCNSASQRAEAFLRTLGLWEDGV